MAQIYGELIRAQLQVSASDLGSPAAGLIYFNSTTGAKWYSGSAWKTAVDLDSSQTLANKSLDATCSINSGILPVVPLTKGGLGADASAWSGLVKISGGVASASSLALTDIPNTLITYAKLNLADGDIPQAKVSGLVTDLAGKLTGNAAITGATKTKITYDSKGLVTAGADLAAGDLPTGIDATKIADGSVDNTEFQKLGTAGTSGAGLLVTTDGLQTLSNKTLASPGVTGNMLVADTADIRFLENGGLDTVVLKGPPSLAATYTFTLPSTPGQANQVLKTDGTGITSWGAGGSGAGGINYLSDYFDATTSISSVSNIAANGNITVNGSTPLLTSAWYADATSGSSAIARSASTALRGSYNYLTALSGTSTSGDTFVQTSAFNVDSSDLGKPVTVSFDLTGVTTDNDWDIVVARYSTTGSSGTGTFVELIPVAGNVSTVTGTPGAKLPTGTTQFKGFFIASSTANDVYALRLRRRAGSAQVRLDSLFVGPQSLAQGAVVTGSQLITATVTNGGTISSQKVNTARVGDKLFFQGTISFSGAGPAAVFQLNMPTGLTIDTSKLSSGSGAFGNSIGTAGWWDQGVGAKQLMPLAYSTTTISFAIDASSVNFQGSDLANGDSINFALFLPISEWSSGTTTLADRAVEEYASNTTGEGTTNGSTYSNSAFFRNGPEGSKFPNIGTVDTTLGSTKYYIQWQNPQLATDNIIIEMRYPGLNTWTPVTEFPQMRMGSSQYGISYVATSATQGYVQFGRAGSLPAGASYGATGNAWNNFYSATDSLSYYWRVRKVSSGAAVGFPVSAANIVTPNTLDNYSGNTKLGFMNYVHGFAGGYNGGLAPTITLTSGGGTLNSVVRSNFIPYQMADSTWRLKCNFVVVLSTVSRTQITISVNGIVSKNTTNFFQPIIGYQLDVLVASTFCYVQPNSNQFVINHGSATTTIYGISCDIELETKPTWAY